jgi:(E)-4-hydroxy-3-methylbut-2-enyl-diphosphate synthase
MINRVSGVDRLLAERTIMARRKTRSLKLGTVTVGGDAPISIQSMTTTRPRDIDATVMQIIGLTTSGCEIVRSSVFNMDDARALGAVKARIGIPLIADIHFDYRLALEAVKQGVDGLRINPGNIGSRERVAAVVAAARERDIPIRIGVNAGSLEKDLLDQHGGPTGEAMVESAFRHIHILEELNYPNLKISLKASTPMLTVEANRLFAERCDYPIHLGVTEAGPPMSGAIKSAAALGILLNEGIGDTVRISLTADPVEEVRAARTLLEALGLRVPGLRIVSCPTCGRCQVPDMIELAQRIEKRLIDIKAPLTVAVMGCHVNGPGEAREADVGIACGKDRAMLFKQGEAVGWLSADEIEDRLVSEVEALSRKQS